MHELNAKITRIAAKGSLLPAIIFLCWQAAAHPMPNSIVRLSVFHQSIAGRAKIPFIDLESALGGRIENIKSGAMEQYFLNHVTAFSAAGNWKTIIKDVQIVVDIDPVVGEYEEVIVHFDLIPVSIDGIRHFTFKYDAVVHQVVTHSIMVFVENDWKNGIHEESRPHFVGTIQLDVPTNRINPLEIKLANGSWFRGVKAMFSLGMKHILEGLDHVLFLLTLLLIAPLAITDNKRSGYQGLRYTVARFFKISLSFTIGHSITLLAGGFYLIDFRAQYVEVLIALSILISAMNCIKPIFFKRETLVAGGFGLIHGLAFSLTLSSMKLDTGSKLLTILGFNLGIEAMQLIIMMAFFPVILLSKRRFYTTVRIFFAFITIILSSAWIFERITGHSNFITALADTLV